MSEKQLSSGSVEQKTSKGVIDHWQPLAYAAAMKSTYDTLAKSAPRKRGLHIQLLGLIERALSPGLGYCFRCRRPWSTRLFGVEYHETMYASDRGCFPLCQGCWEELGSAEARLPYYRLLWELWESQGSDERDWDQLRAGVYAEAGESDGGDGVASGPRSRPSGLTGTAATS